MSPGPTAVWSGRWVATRLGVGVTTTASPVGVEVTDLVGLALRHNPRRAHLLVSRVLGKHVPTSPALVRACGLLLGRLVGVALGQEPTGADDAARTSAALAAALARTADGGTDAGAADRLLALVAAGSGAAPAPLVLGYAETATGLGHTVADALDAPYLHSTRRAVAGVEAAAGFDEAHSHATRHALLPRDPATLARPGPLVLVDDELSTGATALGTIAALHGAFPRRDYVIAALVDLRTAADRERLQELGRRLGARIEVVALAHGEVHLPAGLAAAGPALVASLSAAQAEGTAVGGHAPAAVRRVALDWPADLPAGGRHGFTAQHRRQLEQALPALGRALARRLRVPAGGHVLVLGTEELLHVPLRLAQALAAQLGPGVRVLFSSTTRSPVLAVDDPGSAIRTVLGFRDHDAPPDGPGPRFAYNVAAGAGGRRFDAVLVVLDTASDTAALSGPGGLLTALTAVTDDVLVAVVPEQEA